MILDAVAAALVPWLLTYAMHSTILLGCALLMTRLLSDHHAWLDVIWKTALIGPLVTASLDLGPNTIPLANSAPAPIANAAIHEPAGAAVEVNAATSPIANAGDEVQVAPRKPQVAAPTLHAAGRTLQVASRTLVLGWLLIAAVALTRYGARLIRVYRAIGNTRSAAPPDLLQTIDELTHAAPQRRAITLSTSHACAVPLALAGRRIVVPERFLDLDADQQRAALAHEVAHVVRRDPAWRIAAGLIEHAFVFQPLNRLARARMGESAEFLCDQWAVRHTESPLALARCLSAVAAWASPDNDAWAVGVSAMARSDSAMVRRVEQILNQPARPAPRRRAVWLALPLAFVALGAPRIIATESTTAVQTSTPRRPATQAEIARAQSELRIVRPANAGASLDDRWSWAIADARRQRLSEFWIAYSFATPVHEGEHVIMDSSGNTIISADGHIQTQGPALMDVLGDSGGNIVVLLHYRGTTDEAIDRAGYRSASIGFDFGRAPLFWLGHSDESQSFHRARGMFERSRVEKMQRFFIELASMHGNGNAVIPFLTQLVTTSQPSGIRNEAIEGFGHQHDPRSVDVLVKVARTDPERELRSEAAETIGEVLTPQSIPALTDLVNDSDDGEVRMEAVEAFGEQPAAHALPALEQVIANHRDVELQKEAVETLGDLDDPAVVDALVRIMRDHPDEQVQRQAVETLADVTGDAVHPQIIALAADGSTPAVRREAVEAIADAIEKHGDARSLDQAEQTFERAIFNDPDTSVRMEALDALEQLPRDRELRLLRKVIDTHPDNRLRREAGEHLRERR